jgi:hypothetical protein
MKVGIAPPSVFCRLGILRLSAAERAGEVA